MRLVGAIFALLPLAGCVPDERPTTGPDAGCTEPDPRDPKGTATDEPCRDSLECNDEDLVCLGEGPERRSTCQAPSPILDRGCYERPEIAEVGHCDDADMNEGDVVEDGCTVRTYEIEDNCCLGEKGYCMFDCVDFIRREVWRTCGCCWRLIALIEVYPKMCQ